MASPLENEMPVIPPVNAMDGTTPKEDLGTMAVAPAFAASTYEQSLDSDARWALSEGSRHFNEQSQVFFAMRKIAKRLSELNIPYSVVGGMALFLHGLRRFTEDVDILVTRQDLKTIHEKLEGLGYLSTHMGGKHLRDTEYKVKIKFLTTGDYPGDGKKQPVSFPDPSEVSVEIDGTRYIKVPTLVQLKLASGMTGAGRRRDLSDVQDLIKELKIPAASATELDPYVRKMYL